MSDHDRAPRQDCARGACADCDLGPDCPDYVSSEAPVSQTGNSSCDRKHPKLVVYIAGPISDPHFVTALQNLARFFHLEAMLIKRGFAPLNPAADLIAAIVAGDFEYEDYLGKDEALVPKCDALFVMSGWAQSQGATHEFGWALDAGVPVFESLADLLEYREQLAMEPQK